MVVVRATTGHKVHTHTECGANSRIANALKARLEDGGAQMIRESDTTSQSGQVYHFQGIRVRASSRS